VVDPAAGREGEGLQELLRRGASQIFEHEDPLAFETWLANEGPRALASLGLDDVPADAARPFLGLLARAIWNATPLPAQGYRPLPRPLPAGDEPCLCGSGRTFEECCRRLPAFPPIPEEAVWVALAEAGPLAGLTTAARAGAVPGAVLGRLAERLREAGQAEVALEVLQRAFRTAARPDASCEQALEVLIELTAELQGEAAREALVEELLGRLGPPLRGAVWGCRASLAAEAGDLSAAWSDLGRAQQDDPDSPSLAALELNLLSAEERFDDLRHRARSWRARFRKHFEPGEMDEFMALLDRLVQDPRALAHEAEERDDGDADALGLGQHRDAFVAALERGLARPLPALTLELHGSEGQLVAADQTRAADLQWHAFWGQRSGDGSSAATPAALLDLLAGNAALFDSLGALQGLLELVQELEGAGTLPAPVIERLFERGDAILRQALRSAPESLRLPWSALENRPALGFLADLARRYERTGRPGRARSCCEALLALDPGDHLGAREMLSRLVPAAEPARRPRGSGRPRRARRR
jgi:tetratricopeptide (TPR) repeat protein